MDVIVVPSTPYLSEWVPCIILDPEGRDRRPRGRVERVQMSRCRSLSERTVGDDWLAWQMPASFSPVEVPRYPVPVSRFLREGSDSGDTRGSSEPFDDFSRLQPSRQDDRRTRSLTVSASASSASSSSPPSSASSCVLLAASAPQTLGPSDIGSARAAACLFLSALPFFSLLGARLALLVSL